MNETEEEETERYCALLQGRMEYLAVLYLQRGTINKETI